MAVAEPVPYRTKTVCQSERMRLLRHTVYTARCSPGLSSRTDLPYSLYSQMTSLSEFVQQKLTCTQTTQLYTVSQKPSKHQQINSIMPWQT